MTKKDVEETEAGTVQDSKEAIYERQPKSMPEFAGSYKYWQEAYHKLAAGIHHQGRPDLFATFTLNDQDRDLTQFLTHINDGK